MDDDTAEFEDDESNSDEDERRFLERFLKKCRQHQSRKKRTNALVLEAQQLINELQHGVPRKLAEKRSLKGGAIGLENTSRPNDPPKKKKAENPLKKELSNPQGLDFANQADVLMAVVYRCLDLASCCELLCSHSLSCSTYCYVVRANCLK